MVCRVQCFQAKARLLRTVTIIWVINFKNYIFSNLHAQDFLICILECRLLTITHPHLQQDSVQFSSLAQSCPTLCDPWTTACQASLSITNSRTLPKLMSIESVIPSSHLILCHPLLLVPPIPQSIRVFSNESTLHMRWKSIGVSFSFSISPSSEHPGLISFRMDWLDLLAVQGTLKSLLQHHS